MRWFEGVAKYENAGEPHVLISVIATSGSTPRGVDAKMVVTRNHITDSIGGGKLEHHATNLAREMLESLSTRKIQHMPLAVSADQCCGGSMTLLFEKFSPASHVSLFGGGNVATNVAQLLHACSVPVNWFDSRPEFQRQEEFGCCEPLPEPFRLEPIRQGSQVLVMTHSHTLDFEILKMVIQRVDLDFIGLIGSRTKWERFKLRFIEHGIEPQVLTRITCPLGERQLDNKSPMAIGVSIVEQLLSRTSNKDDAEVLNWKKVGLALIGEHQ